MGIWRDVFSHKDVLTSRRWFTRAVEFGAEILRCAQDDNLRRDDLKSVDKDEIGGGPERAGDCGLGAAGDYDFEDFVFADEGVQECSTSCGRIWFYEGELVQRVVDNFARGGHRRGKTICAELHYGINFVEVPGDAGGHGDG